MIELLTVLMPHLIYWTALLWTGRTFRRQRQTIIELRVENDRILELNRRLLKANRQLLDEKEKRFNDLVIEVMGPGEEV